MQRLSIFNDNIFSDYDFFKEKSASDWKIRHSEYISFINKRNESRVFEISLAGKSVLDKKIMLLKAGRGDTKVIFWSQMHGNEPTATLALLDIFNFLENKSNFQNEIQQILKSCTLYFLPMLNPDGADAFTRRNALGIDINRDALRLQSPEGKILMDLIDEIKPEVGFNLHDQERYYAAGDTKNTAVISLLAPAGDVLKTVDEPRLLSMRLASLVSKMLKKKVPEQISQYSDDFMPTAFGDCIQQKGTSVLLIESGFQKGDKEKQLVRKLNFVSILTSLYAISENLVFDLDTSDYTSLPFNKKDKFFDILLSNLTISKRNIKANVDVGIRVSNIKNQIRYLIHDIGDLSSKTGFDVINLLGRETDLELKIGEKADKLLKSLNLLD